MCWLLDGPTLSIEQAFKYRISAELPALSTTQREVVTTGLHRLLLAGSINLQKIGL